MSYLFLSCTEKTNEQLIEKLKTATDEDVIVGIKKVLASRGYGRKELNELQHRPLQ